MKNWTFFASLLAINVVIHLLRLPHLILENGGGAFVMLYITVVHVVALPLILVEIALLRNRERTSLKDLLALKKASGDPKISQLLIKGFSFLQVFLLFIISCFFIYMIGLSFIHIFEFAALSFDSDFVVLENKSYPKIIYSILGVCFVVLAAYKVSKSYFKKFARFSSQWGLPFCFAVFMIVFVKILLSLNNFDGIKALFYPDFSGLKKDSLYLAIGQSLVSLFVGFNFFGHSLFMDEKNDPIRFVIRAIVQSLFVTLFIGVFALPTIQQSSELAFGASWIFAIFPRWLSYSSYGYYYCFLFYFSLSFIFFYLLVFTLRSATDQLKKTIDASMVEEKLGGACGLLVILGTVVFYQQPLKGWWGQGVYVSGDHIFVNILLPLMGCGLIWMTLTQTKKENRKALFKHQQVFFHNVYFFKSWESAIKFIIPSLIVVSWLLALL